MDVADTQWIKLLDINRSVVFSSQFDGEILLDGTPFKVENYLIQIDSDQEINTTPNSIQNSNESNKIAVPKQKSIKSFKPPTQRSPPKILPLTLVPSPPRVNNNVQKKTSHGKRNNPRSFEEILAFFQCTERDIQNDLSKLPF